MMHGFSELRREIWCSEPWKGGGRQRVQLEVAQVEEENEAGEWSFNIGSDNWRGWGQ
jgi:hypothetical protein